MSFASINPAPYYRRMNSFNTPQTLQSSYIMLPPLRSSYSNSRAFTLSDCSDLSSTTSRRDDTRSSHSALLRSTQMQPYTVPQTTDSPSHSPIAIISPSKQHLKQKTHRKLRTRTRLPHKSAVDPTFKPAPPLKKVRSSKSNIPGESRYWTPSEHKLFVEALLKFGPKDLKSISAYVGTRNMIQCRTHEQKCFMRLMREAQRETMQRNGQDPDALVDVNGKKMKPQKDVYSVSPSCGISLLCVVSEEMARSLQS